MGLGHRLVGLHAILFVHGAADLATNEATDQHTGPRRHQPPFAVAELGAQKPADGRATNCADGLLLGNYLTTPGREPVDDLQMLRDMELEY